MTDILGARPNEIIVASTLPRANFSVLNQNVGRPERTYITRGDAIFDCVTREKYIRTLIYGVVFLLGFFNLACGYVVE